MKSNTKSPFLKRIIINNFLLILFLIFSSVVHASHIPLDQSRNNDLEFTARFFYSADKWTSLAEIFKADQVQDQQYKSFLLGSYYRFHENIRAGLFFKRQYGFRHNADWIVDSVVDWRWRNTNDRAEDLVIFDLSPRVLLPFLPGDGWTFDFKTRYEYNFFNKDQYLRLVPTVTYYWIHNDSPFINVYVQAEQAFPVNFKSEGPTEKWLYLGLLYSFDSQWQVGLSTSKKEMSWKSTDEFVQLTGASYNNKNSSTAMGLLLIYKL